VDALNATGSPRGPGAGTWILIGLQVTFSTFLLVAAALFGATFSRLLARPLGFSPDGVLALRIESPRQPPPALWAVVVTQTREVAGVESAALAAWTPLSDNRWRGEARVPGSAGRGGSVHLIDVGPAYFETLRIAMLDGRDFAPGERDVAVVNEAFARSF